MTPCDRVRKAANITSLIEPRLCVGCMTSVFSTIDSSSLGHGNPYTTTAHPPMTLTPLRTTLAHQGKTHSTPSHCIQKAYHRKHSEPPIRRPYHLHQHTHPHTHLHYKTTSEHLIKSAELNTLQMTISQQHSVCIPITQVETVTISPGQVSHSQCCESVTVL